MWSQISALAISHPGQRRVPPLVCKLKTNLVHNFFCMFISFLYMFRANLGPSREITLSMRHLVFVTLCRWPSGMQDGMKFFHPILHTRRSSTQSDKYQVSHWYSNFSWWWAHSCLKHVENRNRHTIKIVHQFDFICKNMKEFAELSSETSCRPIYNIPKAMDVDETSVDSVLRNKSL